MPLDPDLIKFVCLPTKYHFHSAWHTATGTVRLNYPSYTRRYLKIPGCSEQKVQCCQWRQPFSQLDETAGLSSDDNADPMRNLVCMSSKAAFLALHSLFSTVHRTIDSISQYYHQPKRVGMKHLKPAKLEPCSHPLTSRSGTLSVSSFGE